jgi:hypothetical protein
MLASEIQDGWRLFPPSKSSPSLTSRLSQVVVNRSRRTILLRPLTGLLELGEFGVGNLGLVPSPQPDDLLAIEIQLFFVHMTGIRDSLCLSEILGPLDWEDVTVSLTRCVGVQARVEGY